MARKLRFDIPRTPRPRHRPRRQPLPPLPSSAPVSTRLSTSRAHRATERGAKQERNNDFCRAEQAPLCACSLESRFSRRRRAGRSLTNPPRKIPHQRTPLRPRLLDRPTRTNRPPPPPPRPSRPPSPCPHRLTYPPTHAASAYHLIRPYTDAYEAVLQCCRQHATVTNPPLQPCPTGGVWGRVAGVHAGGLRGSLTDSTSSVPGSYLPVRGGRWHCGRRANRRRPSIRWKWERRS